MKFSQIILIGTSVILYMVVLLVFSSTIVTYTAHLHQPFLGSSLHAQDIDARIVKFLWTGDHAYLRPLSVDENLHIRDFRSLMQHAVLVGALAAILWIMLFVFSKHRLAILLSPFVLFLFGLPYALIIRSKFTAAMDFFHTLFFPQGNFSFHPSSLLITTYPESFFISMTFLIGAISSILALLILLIVVGIKKQRIIYSKKKIN